MLTYEQRRELLQNMHDRFGLQYLLDMCALDLTNYQERNLQLREQLEGLKNVSAQD
jgi:hypothetical protein